MRSSVSLALLALTLAGCAGRRETIGYDAVGRATWYGEAFAGRRTASGAIFDPGAMTAAHRTLPFGTVAEVTALTTGRRVRVVINDRGPVDRSRLIDLSRAAARALGPERALAHVRVRAPVPGVRRLPRHETREPLDAARDVAAASGYADATPIQPDPTDGRP